MDPEESTETLKLLTKNPDAEFLTKQKDQQSSPQLIRTAQTGWKRRPYSNQLFRKPNTRNVHPRQATAKTPKNNLEKHQPNLHRPTNPKRHFCTYIKQVKNEKRKRRNRSYCRFLSVIRPPFSLRRADRYWLKISALTW